MTEAKFHFPYVAAVMVAAFAAVTILSWLSLWSFATVSISQPDLWSGLTGLASDPSVGSRIVQQIRVPRTLGAMLVGASLGLCGLMMQGVTRNRLASPSVLGVTAGASLALALVSSGVVPVDLPFSSLIATVIGGAIAWLLVFVLGTAWSIGATSGRLVLAGITVAALCSGLMRLVVLLAEERALGVLNWLAGGLSNLRMGDIVILLPVMLGAVLLSSVLANSLNLINLGAESAQALGTRIRSVNVATFIGCCVITGAAVTFAGPIGFIGLMAPNLARVLVGYDFRRLVPVTAMFGAIILLASDIVARAVAFPAETPAGAVTALVGAPVFLLLARKQR